MNIILSRNPYLESRDFLLKLMLLKLILKVVIPIYKVGIFYLTIQEQIVREWEVAIPIYKVGIFY